MKFVSKLKGIFGWKNKVKEVQKHEGAPEVSKHVEQKKHEAFTALMGLTNLPKKEEKNVEYATHVDEDQDRLAAGGRHKENFRGGAEDQRNLKKKMQWYKESFPDLSESEVTELMQFFDAYGVTIADLRDPKFSETLQGLQRMMRVGQTSAHNIIYMTRTVNTFAVRYGYQFDKKELMKVLQETTQSLHNSTREDSQDVIDRVREYLQKFKAELFKRNDVNSEVKGRILMELLSDYKNKNTLDALANAIADPVKAEGLNELIRVISHVNKREGGAAENIGSSYHVNELVAAAGRMEGKQFNKMGQLI